MANEKRLIDANKLQRRLVALSAEPNYQHPDEDWGVGVCMAETVVSEMPTEDAVEVVRCKNCIYYKAPCREFNYHHCSNGQWDDSDGWAREIKPDDFCSYGERREGV